MNNTNDRFKTYDLHAPPGCSTCFYVHSNRSIKRLKEKLGKITLQDLGTITEDHVNYPFSICRHLCHTARIGPTSSAKTVTAVIMQPKNLTFSITHGNPCENEYITC